MDDTKYSPSAPLSATSWTVLRAAGQSAGVAVRFDIAGCPPVEMTFTHDALAALFLEFEGASDEGRRMSLFAIVAMGLPVASGRLLQRAGLWRLAPALFSLCSDVVSGWPLTAFGATYTGTTRLAGRCVGLGTGHTWKPRLLSGAAVIPRGW